MAESTFVRALYPYNGNDAGALSFEQGDIIGVASMLASGWWDGTIITSGTRGWFPSNYVTPITKEEASWAFDQMEAAAQASKQAAADPFANERRPSANGSNTGSVDELEQAIWASLGGQSMDADLTSSFSTGGNIFAEIAAANESSPYSQRSHESPPRNLQSQRQTSPDRHKANGWSAAEVTDDDWLPKLTDDGQIIYVNSRTGETSTTSPFDDDNNLAQHTNGHHSPAASPKHRKTDSQKSSKSHSSGSPRQQRPVSGNSIPSDWLVRTLEDGVTTYYENRHTRETRWSFPGSANANGSLASETTNNLETFPNIPQRQVSDMTARPGKHSDESQRTKGPTPKASVNAMHQSQLSWDSDDSSADPIVSPPKRLPELPETGSSNATAQAIVLPAELAYFSTNFPSLSQMDADIQSAVEDLVGFVQVPEDDRNLDKAVDRESVSAKTALLVDQVRKLVHITGLLDATVHKPQQLDNPKRASVTDPASEERANQLKPYAKRVTSPLNKLVLNVRALWGMLNTSSEEEDIIQHAFIAIELEEDVLALKTHRHEIVQGRLASERQLRSDIAMKASELGKAIALLVAFLATLPAISDQTPPGIVAKAESDFRTDIVSLLGAGNGRGANWKGNGFSVGPANTERRFTRLGDAPVPTLKNVYSKSSFDAAAVAAYGTTHNTLQQHLADFKGTLLNVKRTADKRASVASEFSTKLAPVASTSRLTPANEAAYKHSASLFASITTIDSILSKTLASIEDWNISDKLDIESGELGLQSLLDLQNDVAGKGKEKADDNYAGSLKSARMLLSKFNELKQKVYDSRATLLLCMQDIGAMEVTRDHLIADWEFAACLAQPSFASPMNDFTLPSISEHIVAEMEAAVDDLRSSSSILMDSTKALLELTLQQAQASQAARSANIRRRTLIESHRLSQISLSSSVSSRHSLADKQTMPSSRNSLSQTSQRHLAQNSYGSSDDSLVGPPKPALNLNTVQAYEGVHAESYSESIRSYNESEKSSMFLLNGNAGPSMSKNPSQMSSTQESPTARSPSTSKIKQFFGNDAPAPEFGRRAAPIARPEVPAYLRLDFEDELTMMGDQVKGGTLRALVARLTSHEHTMSVDLFRLLVQRYHALPPVGLNNEQMKAWTTTKQTFIRMRTVNIIKTWLESYFWEPPQNAEMLLKAIHDFAVNGLADPVSIQQIVRSVERRRTSGLPRRMSAVDTSLAPPPIMPRFSRKVKFLDIDATELARQLTIITSQHYCRITPHECMSKAWPKKFGSETPTISAMTAFENNTATWVQETVMIADDAKKRATAIKHFIAIAERCHKLQNFSILVHIIAGLDATPVRRLRRTWELVNNRTIAIFDMLKAFMSSDRKFARYREALRTMGPPCVPFMGVFLTSWTYIGDAMPDFLVEQSDHINFTKRQRAAELMQQIELHQSTPYNLHTVQAVADYLQAAIMSPSSDAVLWERSLQIEPREREDEKIARLLSESGFL